MKMKMKMKVLTISSENSLTCIRSIGGFIFFEEDWMKQKKYDNNINVNEPKIIKTQSEILNTVNYEVNQFNT